MQEDKVNIELSDKQFVKFFNDYKNLYAQTRRRKVECYNILINITTNDFSITAKDAK